jgi:hypothetical protein
MKKTSLFLVVAFAAMTALYAQRANPFIGIWLFTGSNGLATQEYIFGEGTFIFIQEGNYWRKGVYTYTSTQLTMTDTHFQERGVWLPAGSKPSTQTYKVSGDTLTLGRFAFKKTAVSHARGHAPLDRFEPAPNQPSPVGTWRGSSLNTGGETLTFNADGTGWGSSRGNFKWERTGDGNVLNMGNAGGGWYSIEDGEVLTMVQNPDYPHYGDIYIRQGLEVPNFGP